MFFTNIQKMDLCLFPYEGYEHLCMYVNLKVCTCFKNSEGKVA